MGDTSVSEKSMVKKGVSRFSVEIFPYQIAKKVRAEPFNVSEKMG